MDIVVRVLNSLLMIVLPLALGVYLYRKHNTDWLVFGIGIVTFLASQILHIPFNMVVFRRVTVGWLEKFTDGSAFLLFAILVGLSAGLFEEIARWVSYKIWLKQDRNWKSALMFGAGHGGIEAILVGILAGYGLSQALLLRSLDPQILSPSQIDVAQQFAVYWELPWHAVLLGFFERIAAICFHLSAAVLVLQVFTRKQSWWLGIAILWHTVFNAVVLVIARALDVYVSTATALFLGVISIGIVILLKPVSSEPEALETISAPLQEITLSTPDPTADSIDESMYNSQDQI